MKTTNTTRIDARDALTTRETNVEALIARLTAKLAEKKAHNATHTPNWGDVGDLTETETRLADLVAFLGA